MTIPESPPSFELALNVGVDLFRFLDERHSARSRPRDREDQFYPPFVRLADSIHAARSGAGPASGWPDSLTRWLEEVASHFDGLAKAWGWKEVAEPDPVRTVFIERRVLHYMQGTLRPLLVAAVSMERSIPSQEWPDGMERFVKEGFAGRCRSTMSQEEARAAYPVALERWLSTMILGESPLKFPEGPTDGLAGCLDAFDKLMKLVGLDAVRRRILEAEDVVRPIPGLLTDWTSADFKLNSRPMEIIPHPTHVKLSCTAEEIRRDAESMDGTLDGLRKAAEYEAIYGRGIDVQDELAAYFSAAFKLSDDLEQRGMRLIGGRTMALINLPESIAGRSALSEEARGAYFRLFGLLQHINPKAADQFPEIEAGYLKKLEHVAGRIRRLANGLSEIRESGERSDQPFRPSLVAGDITTSATVSPINASQSAIARALGRSENTARLLNKLAEEGLLRYEHVPGRKNLWRVWFADPAQHESIRQKIYPTS